MTKKNGENSRDQSQWANAVMERPARHGALGETQAQEADSKRFLVRVTSVRKILLDEDNLCEKYHVDCCRYAGLISGDEPSKTKIEVGQRKAQKGEEEHVVVQIFENKDAK